MLRNCRHVVQSVPYGRAHLRLHRRRPRLFCSDASAGLRRRQLRISSLRLWIANVVASATAGDAGRAGLPLPLRLRSAIFFNLSLGPLFLVALETSHLVAGSLGAKEEMPVRPCAHCLLHARAVEWLVAPACGQDGAQFQCRLARSIRANLHDAGDARKGLPAQVQCRCFSAKVIHDKNNTFSVL